MTIGEEDGSYREDSQRDPLGESGLFLRELVELIPATTYVYSQETLKIWFVSPQVEELLGYSRAEILADPSFWSKIVHPDDWAMVRRTLTDSLGRTGKYVFDYRVKLKSGGTAWIHDEGKLHTRKGKTGAVLGVLTDVTEHRRLEERLLQAEKTRTLGLLAGGMAHDFGNILTVIRGYAGICLAQTPADSPARAPLEEVLRSARRATALTRRLMVLARKRQEAPLPLDINQTVREVRDLLGKLLGENVRIDLDLAAEPCIVLLDPAEAWQIILNLALNARDAMPLGGDLVVSTSVVPEKASSQEPSFVLLSVSDTGIGMEAETLARAFEPFFSTKDPTSGTGLGLATVQSIVQLRAGNVEADSRPGHGTRISIRLPRIDELAEAGTPLDGEAGEGRPTETVLLVEDDEAVRTLLRATLKAAGYHVLDAGTAEEALDMSNNFAEEIHALVTDVVLPVQNGPELARQIRVTRPHCAVLLLSGYSSAAIRNLTREGDEPILQKPFPPERLLSAVRTALKRAS